MSQSQSILDLENICQSPAHSPGTVRSEEYLLRLWHHPEHIHEGKLIASAIPGDDIDFSNKTRGGFSIDRKDYHSKEIIQTRAVQQKERSPEKRKKSFISIFMCLSVRQILQDDGRRSLIILDTALPYNQAHASIYGTVEKKGAELKKIRNQLVDLFNKQELISLPNFLNQD